MGNSARSSQRRKWWIAAAVALVEAAAAAGPADSPPGADHALYRWTDAQGHVHYSDRVPPDAAPRAHAQIDAKGRTRRSVEGERSAAEIAGEAQRKQAEAQQAKYDSTLLQSYASSAELRAAREEQLQALTARRAAAAKASADNLAAVAELRSRDAAADGPEAAAKLAQQIDSFSAAAKQAADTRDQLDAESKTTATRFDADLRRYEELRAGAGEAPHPPR